MILQYDLSVSDQIERRHRIPEGLLPQTMLRDPSAKLAAAGFIPHSRWLRLVEGTLPPAAIQEWFDYHGQLNQPAVDLLARARTAGLQVVFMSNAGQRLRDDLAHHSISDLADHVYCSKDLGLAKPDPRAYQYLIDTLPLTPVRTLYVDAAPPCVHTAFELGMQAHVFRDAEPLRQRLAQAGVPL